MQFISKLYTLCLTAFRWRCVYLELLSDLNRRIWWICAFLPHVQGLTCGLAGHSDFATYFYDTRYIISEKRSNLLQGGIRIFYCVVQDGCHQCGKMVNAVVAQDVGDGLHDGVKRTQHFRPDISKTD